MKLTDEQKHIIMEIDSIAKMKTVETWESRWLQYIGENSRNMGPGRKTLSDFSLPKRRNKETLVIIGPGPSVTQYADRLPELREAATVCILPTALEWCESNGLLPDFVVVQDSGHREAEFFPRGHYEVLGPTTLNPTVVIEQSPCLFTLMLGSGGDDPVYGPWNSFCLGIDSDLDGGLLSMGCVTNMAIEVIELFRATGQLAAEKIVLLGQDFGGWKGLARVPKLEETECPTVAQHVARHDWQEWNGFTTDARMIWYKWLLLRLWVRTEAPLYSCSNGMLHELPYVFFDNILRGNWPKRYPKRKVMEERFTAFAALMADTFPREEDEVPNETE